MNKIKYPLKIDTNLFNKNNKTNSSFYGLSKNVVFCKKCVISNQKPNSTAEFKNNIKEKKKQFILMIVEYVMRVILPIKRKKLIGMIDIKSLK